jgi:hypothetical protein
MHKTRLRVRALTIGAALLLPLLPSMSSAAITMQAKPMSLDEDARCVKTTVATTGNDIANDPSSGIVVTFASNLGVEHIPQARAGVVDRSTYLQHSTFEYKLQTSVLEWQVAPNGVPNPIAAAERAGDEVQLCLIAVPEPTIACDPLTDPRGRTYRVYDYRQHAAYSDTNSNHACGGA